MNPRRNIQRKRRAQRRMVEYNTNPWNILDRCFRRLLRDIHRMRAKPYPAPPFPRGGIIAPAPAGRTGEPILPAHLRSPQPGTA